MSCYVPAANYMVIDPRRDHGMRVPRPDLSAKLGVPNACNEGRTKHDAAWAADAVRRWYGHDAAGLQNYATVFHDADISAPRSGAALARVVAGTEQPAIARASALAHLEQLGDPAVVAAA